MARIRYIKPEFYSDTKLSEVSILGRYLYAGLFCQLDKQGITIDDSKFLKREIFPYDEDITIKKIDSLLDELVHNGRLSRFEYGGKKYLYCPTLKKHQKFHKDEKPKYCIPDKILSAPSQQGASTLVPSDRSELTQQLGALVTGNGELVTNNGELETTKTLPFDFEPLWKIYPRRVNKSEALERFERLIRSVLDYQDLKKAIVNYAADCAKHQTLPPGIRHFSSFLGTEKLESWRDWIEPPDSGPAPPSTFEFADSTAEATHA